MNSIGKCPSCSFRTFSNSLSSAACVQQFFPVAFGEWRDSFLARQFHFAFIAVSVRASVIRPFVVNFFLDLYLISDREWRDFAIEGIVRPTLFGKCIRIEIKWRQSTKSGYKTLAAYSLRVAQAEWIRLCAFHRLSHFNKFFFTSSDNEFAQSFQRTKVKRKKWNNLFIFYLNRFMHYGPYGRRCSQFMKTKKKTGTTACIHFIKLNGMHNLSESRSILFMNAHI